MRRSSDLVECGKLNPDAVVVYEYSKSGQITARTANGVRQTYEYDKKGQLLAVKDADGNAVERYAYDRAGNMVRKTLAGKTTTFTFDAANQLVSSTTDGVTTEYAYDAAGRLVKEGNKTYCYGYLDKVLSVTEGERKYTYNYHADGQLARADYGNGGRAGCPLPAGSEDFLWDGLALIKRGDEGFVNEPHVGGGNPVISSKGVTYLNDMLGTTVGAKKGARYSAAALTAFGESGSRHTFYTGKPQVDGLGHAFLFRNYRAGLGKWQTADPLGYPDGWNQLAYCGNGAIDFIDYCGAYARCVFDISDAVFAMEDQSTGKLFGVSASSGDMNVDHQWIEKGVLPIGEWKIIAHPEAYRLQLWYCGDSTLDDIAKGPNGAERKNIRLVIAEADQSHGCICLSPQQVSYEIMEALKATSYEWVRSNGANYRCYGTVRVVE